MGKLVERILAETLAELESMQIGNGPKKGCRCGHCTVDETSCMGRAAWLNISNFLIVLAWPGER